MLRYDDLVYVSFPSFRRSTASSGNEDGIIEVNHCRRSATAWKTKLN